MTTHHCNQNAGSHPCRNRLLGQWLLSSCIGPVTSRISWGRTREEGKSIPKINDRHCHRRHNLQGTISPRTLSGRNPFHTSPECFEAAPHLSFPNIKELQRPFDFEQSWAVAEVRNVTGQPRKLTTPKPAPTCEESCSASDQTSGIPI